MLCSGLWIGVDRLSSQFVCWHSVLDGTRGHLSNGRWSVRWKGGHLVTRNHLHRTGWVQRRRSSAAVKRFTFSGFSLIGWLIGHWWIDFSLIGWLIDWSLIGWLIGHRLIGHWSVDWLVIDCLIDSSLSVQWGYLLGWLFGFFWLDWNATGLCGLRGVATAHVVFVVSVEMMQRLSLCVLFQPSVNRRCSTWMQWVPYTISYRMILPLCRPLILGRPTSLNSSAPVWGRNQPSDSLSADAYRFVTASAPSVATSWGV